MSRPRLRAKTGCLTCRARKIKCGEERPCCMPCLRSNRPCRWPQPEDLIDRRHRNHWNFRASRSSRSSQQLVPLSSLPSPAPVPVYSPNEGMLIHHYASAFAPVLLVPAAKGRFVDCLRLRIFEFMRDDGSAGLQDAVLASSASNLFARTGRGALRQVARCYYSRAVSQVYARIRQIGSDPTKPVHSGAVFPLLLAVIFLYLDGSFGLDNATHTLPHLKGAMQLLDFYVAHPLHRNAELGHASGSDSNSDTRPYDRVAVESILYQAFMLAVRHPFATSFPFDFQMLIRIERMLDTTFPTRPIPQGTLSTSESPILGAPVSLFRITLAIVSYCHAPGRLQPGNLAEIRASLSVWESACRTEADRSSTNYFLPQRDQHAIRENDAAVLIVLMASLLLDAVSAVVSAASTSQDRIPPSNVTVQDYVVECCASFHRPWQVQRALELLRQAETADRCTGFYLTLWPIMVLGYAVTRVPDDVALVRKLLSGIYRRIGYGEAQRMLDDLEILWRSRNGPMMREEL